MPFMVIRGEPSTWLAQRPPAVPRTLSRTGTYPVHFKPANPRLLDASSASIGRSGSLASARHNFAWRGSTPSNCTSRARTSRALADQACDNLTGELGLNPVPYASPEHWVAV